MTASDPQPARWCQGLKSIGFRDLLPEETKRLRGEVKLTLLRFWQPAAIAAASPSVLYLSYLISGDGPETLGPRLIIGLAFLFVGLMVLPALSLLKLRDSISLWKALRSDLKERRVECFSSPKSLGEGDAEASESLEVFPHSGMVFLVNDYRPSHRMFVNVCAAIAPPEYASQYALPKELTASIPNDVREQASFERRRLSPAEIEELTQHARRLRRPSGALIVFGIWCGMGLIAAVLSYLHGDFTDWRQKYLIPFLGLTAVTTWLSVQYARMLRTSRQLAQDAASGWVLVVEQKDDAHAGQEVLPISSAVWSTENKPSEWRLVQGRRKRQRHKSKEEDRK